MRGCPLFSFWVSIALAKICFSRLQCSHKQHCAKIRAVHSGWGGGGGVGWRICPAWKTDFFLTVIEFAELFLVAILVRNKKKINLLTEKKSPFNVNSVGFFCVGVQTKTSCLYTGDPCGGVRSLFPPPPTKKSSVRF